MASAGGTIQTAAFILTSNGDGTDTRPVTAHSKTVINPAKIPAGTELFFGYSNSYHAIFFGLIYTHSCTCGSQPPRLP
jgi:hypothetical protein